MAALAWLDCMAGYARVDGRGVQRRPLGSLASRAGSCCSVCAGLLYASSEPLLFGQLLACGWPQCCVSNLRALEASQHGVSWLGALSGLCNCVGPPAARQCGYIGQWPPFLLFAPCAAVTPVRLRLSEESRDATRGVEVCAPFFDVRVWVRVSCTQCCVRLRARRCVRWVFRVPPSSTSGFCQEASVQASYVSQAVAFCGVFEVGE